MKRKPRQASLPAMPGRGRALAELRRSNAAGIHGKRQPVRGSTKRRAIADVKQLRRQT